MDMPRLRPAGHVSRTRLRRRGRFGRGWAVNRDKLVQRVPGFEMVDHVGAVGLDSAAQDLNSIGDAVQCGGDLACVRHARLVVVGDDPDKRRALEGRGHVRAPVRARSGGGRDDSELFERDDRLLALDPVDLASAGGGVQDSPQPKDDSAWCAWAAEHVGLLSLAGGQFAVEVALFGSPGAARFPAFFAVEQSPVGVLVAVVGDLAPRPWRGVLFGREHVGFAQPERRDDVEFVAPGVAAQDGLAPAAAWGDGGGGVAVTVALSVSWHGATEFVRAAAHGDDASAARADVRGDLVGRHAITASDTTFTPATLQNTRLRRCSSTLCPL